MKPLPAVIQNIFKAAIIPLLLLTGIIFYDQYGNYIEIDYIQQQNKLLQTYYQQQPFLTVALFTLFSLLCISVAIPGGQVLPIIAGLFFGYSTGFVVAIICYAIGPILPFLLARYCIGNFLQNKFALQLQTFNRGFEKDGVWYLLIIRQLPLPFFAVNLSLGLTSIHLSKYIWINFFALLPVSLTSPYYGTILKDTMTSDHLLSTELVISLALITILPSIAALLLIRYIRFRKESKKQS